MSRSGVLKPVLVAMAAATGVALLGGLMTDIGPWYQSLKQPAFKPPDWAFGPAWTVIFALTAAAGVYGWRSAPDRRSRDALMALFALNAFLNVLWSLLFFRLQRPDWALMEIPMLWLSVLALILALRRYTPLGSRLLWPYLAWVTFAASINAATVQLNGPFQTALP
ncbi:MAG: TspO/MBR family protein [Hydrogenophaga sp.]|nr:TspO/MBR family protein [Hydrogenophaga sp.]